MQDKVPRADMVKRVGITTTVPIEIIFAAEKVPIDLNNCFINDENPEKLIEEAEIRGFPRNFCCWIKGIYSIAKRIEGLESIVAVTQGDCSNTHALMEMLEAEGFKVLPFAYPYDADKKSLGYEMTKLANSMGVSIEEAEEKKTICDETRQWASVVDEMTWNNKYITGFDNHITLINCSDMNGDPVSYKEDLMRLVEEHSKHEGRRESGIRLAYIGVPPVCSDIYGFVESQDASFVFNEVQRQFSMIPFIGRNLIESYASFTYPYRVNNRINDIIEQSKRRHIDGIVHYVQSFCFRAVEDIMIRRAVRLPVLTIEMDSPGALDERTKTRLETFISMLRSAKN